ncbi:MAG TPA: DUF6468 domain-containing protein, partial [Alphaproteobacteria bacterium]|nr:DUF6468 domain-containing protein [Alphaproteobacteria bacterium]
MQAVLPLIMDVVVLVVLAVTIYYAVRLSAGLNAFRQYRHEFANVLAQLSRNIEQANSAILGLKEASRSSGEHLQELVDQARLLADELTLINQAGDSLAGRLEGLAEKSRKVARGEDPAEDDIIPAKKGRNGTKTKVKMGAEDKSFFIQDRDYDTDAMDEAGIPDELQSQAERELY